MNHSGHPTPVALLLCAHLLLVPLPSSSLQENADSLVLDVRAPGNLEWLLERITPNSVVPNPKPSRRRLLLSYDIAPEKSPYTYHRSATYDNALAALVFTITGEMDAAAFTLHALARLLRPDGSLWFSYNTANSWPDENDHDSALVRGGAVSWVGYAFTFYLTHTPLCQETDRGCARERTFFRATAERLARYLLSLQVDAPGDPRHGLIRLGYGGIELEFDARRGEVIEVYFDRPAIGISTENNISAWFFLRQLASLTGDTRWGDAAGRIRRGLHIGAWNEALGQFNRGFHREGNADTAKALDCASWGTLLLLASGDTTKAQEALGAMDRYYASETEEVSGYRPYFDHPIYQSPEVSAFYFPEDPRKEWRQLPIVWTEGTLSVALAYLRAGQTERAREIFNAVKPLRASGGGFRYATTEIKFEMTDAPSVAASAWVILVGEALRGNPLARQFWK